MLGYTPVTDTEIKDELLARNYKSVPSGGPSTPPNIETPVDTEGTSLILLIALIGGTLLALFD